jgi:hypothetical protein
MPLYDYYCPTNERKVEVRHRMLEEIRTWGDLVTAAGLEVDDTPAEAEVRRLITGGSVLRSSSAGESAPAASCGIGCGCHGG